MSPGRFVGAREGREIEKAKRKKKTKTKTKGKSHYQPEKPTHPPKKKKKKNQKPIFIYLLIFYFILCVEEKRRCSLCLCPPSIPSHLYIQFFLSHHISPFLSLSTHFIPQNTLCFFLSLCFVFFFFFFWFFINHEEGERSRG